MKIKKLLLKVADIRLFFFATLWLMFLLTIGTIDQKNIGLHQAQIKYFSSFFVWFGPIPTPGGTLTMGVIFLGLLFQLILKTPLTIRTSGIAITHLGSFLLLTGGILTGLFSVEGSMVIDENQTVGYFRDYHKLELAVIDTSDKTKDTTTAFAQGWLEKGKSLKHNSLPFEIEITNFCKNCDILQRSVEDNTRSGFSKRFRLQAKNLAKEESENRSGIEFNIKTNKGTQSYMIVEFMPVKQSLDINGKKYIIDIRHKHYPLPFKLELLDFDKRMHAATTMAKAYKSIVNLKDKDFTQRSVIQMNEPLRYKGYTFYQSSFVEEGDKQTTILAVVKNIGRMFPYISSIIICIGILIHLVLNFSTLFSKRAE